MNVLEQKRTNHTGMPEKLKSGVEKMSGYDMNDVKVHYNSMKPAQFHALAFTQGSEIHVGPGQEKHLPHEAWHVVQQKQGRVTPTGTIHGTGINDNTGLEQEADVMGAKAVQLKADTAKEALTNQELPSTRVVQMAQKFSNAAQANHRIRINAKLNHLDPHIQMNYVQQIGNKNQGFREKYAIVLPNDMGSMKEYIVLVSRIIAVIGNEIGELVTGDNPVVEEFYVEISGTINGNPAGTGVKYDNVGLAYIVYGNYANGGAPYEAHMKEDAMAMRVPGYGGVKFDARHSTVNDGGILKAATKTIGHDVEDADKKKGNIIDQQAKLLAEGARFQCVREHIGDIENKSVFWCYQKEGNDYVFYSLNFIELWQCWDRWFNKQFNITNHKVCEKLRAERSHETHLPRNIVAQNNALENNSPVSILVNQTVLERKFYLGTKKEYITLRKEKELNVGGQQ